MNGDRGTAIQEWKTGWALVLAASMGFSFFSLLLAATGVFMEPLTKEFHWSRTLLSSGPSIAVTLTALLSPPFGMVIDKFGSRRVVLPGLILTMASVASFSLLNGTQTQWVALWLVFGLCALTIKSTAWTAGVLGIFTQARGLALGLTLAGTAVAQMVVPPLTNWLIDTVGWRYAFVGLSLGWGSITWLLCFFFFFDAHDKAKRLAAAGVEAAAKPVLTGLTPAQAIRDSALWRLAISNFVVMLLTMGLTVHLFEILREAGISRTHAAYLTSLGGAAGIIGKLVTGWLLDRYRPNWVGGVTLGIAALTFLLLMNGIRSPTLIIIALLVNGYAAGSKTQITGFATANYGGMKHFGVIYGVMGGLMALASGLGPLTAGIIYDKMGGYGPFLLAGAIGCTLGGVLMVSLPAYPTWAKREEPTII